MMIQVKGHQMTSLSNKLTLEIRKRLCGNKNRLREGVKKGYLVQKERRM